MRRPSPEPHYRLLARHYDRVMVDIAGLFRRVRRSLLADVLPGVESVCDLACGSGDTALDFARSGRRVIAVDLSPGQVRSVRRKARAGGLSIEVRRGDMRSFRLPSRVDLVTCEFDALNHVPRRSDLNRVVRAVWRALAPGGWFYFDVNTEHGFRRLWTVPGFVDAGPVTLFQRGEYDARRRRAVLLQDWFVRQGRLWKRESERYEEVCWTGGEIRGALRRAGFRKISAHDGAPFFAGWDWDTPGCRIFYLARKPLRAGLRPSGRSRRSPAAP